MKKGNFTKTGLWIPAVGFVFFLGLLFQGAVTFLYAEDFTIEKQSTSSGMMGSGGGTTTSTEYYSDNAIRSNSSEGTDTIIRLDTQKVVTIDNIQKTYSEMTFQQLQELVDKSLSQLDENSEAMAAMKKMMGPASDSFTVTNEGPGGEIAGYATEKYHMQGPMDIYLWAAPDFSIPEKYYDVMKSRLPKNPLIDFDKLYNEIKKINGMILKSELVIKVMNMEIKTTEITTSAQKGPIPLSVFQVPEGYRPVPFDQ